MFQQNAVALFEFDKLINYFAKTKKIQRWIGCKAAAFDVKNSTN